MRWQSVVGLVLLLIGSLLAFLLSGAGWIDLPQLQGQPVYQIHAVALSFPGLAMGLGAALTRPFVDTDWDEPDRTSDLLGALLIVLIVSMAALLLGGVVSGGVTAVTAALLLVMATLTLLIAVQTLASIRQSDGVAFDSHWGGLGGGLGGWRLSKTATLILLLLVFASATVSVAVYQPAGKASGEPAKDKDPVKPKEERKTTAAPAATPAAAPAAKGG